MTFEGMATPLGRKPGPSRRGVPPWWRWSMFALLVGVIVVLAFSSGVRQRSSSQAIGAVAVIERVELAADGGGKRPDPGPVEPSAASGRGGSRTASAEIEGSSGVNVIRQNGGQVPGGVVIKVPDTPERAGTTLADPRISERSQFGVLPRISESGELPRVIYSRPFVPSGKPMIGIVMTGVGIGARGTADAIAKLPGAVTLAFAPYGRDLENQVLRARRDGHEIMLQVPMEPRDYPESDPGPHTLRANAVARENIERLHWLMTRFSGYVGLTNFLGGKLMAEAGTYGSILEEVNRRGLLFLDDGSAPATRTLDLGKKLGLPVGVADRIHDSGGTKSLETLLQEIEDIARREGRAIISIPAVPANVEKIAVWERDLSARGLVLVPVSAIIGRPAR